MPHCMMPSQALTKIHGRSRGHKPPTRWRSIRHTVKSMRGMGFGPAFFGKSAHMKTISFHSGGKIETFRGGRQGKSVTTQTKQTSSIPNPLCSRNTEKHSYPNNMGIQTLMNTYLKPSMVTRQPATLPCLNESKVPVQFRGLDQVSATWEASGTGKSPVGDSLPLPHHRLMPRHAQLCLFISVLLNVPPTTSSPLRSSLALLCCLMLLKDWNRSKDSGKRMKHTLMSTHLKLSTT